MHLSRISRVCMYLSSYGSVLRVSRNDRCGDKRLNVVMPADEAVNRSGASFSDNIDQDRPQVERGG